MYANYRKKPPNVKTINSESFILVLLRIELALLWCMNIRGPSKKSSHTLFFSAVGNTVMMELTGYYLSR